MNRRDAQQEVDSFVIRLRILIEKARDLPVDARSTIGFLNDALRRSSEELPPQVLTLEE